MQGKTIGIIGMERIGQATARHAALALGMKVVFYNRSPALDFGFEAMSNNSHRSGAVIEIDKERALLNFSLDDI